MSAKDVVVDMSKIIAKLHLGALMKIKSIYNDGSFIVNTGIKNDDPNMTPDKPGKVTFDLDNALEQYEVGYVTKITAKVPFDDQKLASELEKLLDKISQTSIKDKNANASNDVEEQLSGDINGFMTVFQAMFEKYDGLDIIKDENSYGSWKAALQSKDPEKMDNAKKEMLKCLTSLKQQTSDKQIYGKDFEEAQKKAIDVLTKYMTVFAGASNVDKLSKDNVADMLVSPNASNANYEGLVKDFKIQSISNAEYSALMSKQASPGNAKNAKDLEEIVNFESKICFKVEYSLSVS